MLQRIALPAYCCSSMVYPLCNKGLSIVFYPMPKSFEEPMESEISLVCDAIRDADAVLVMDYFGFVRTFALQVARSAHRLGKKIVLDVTQTAFSRLPTYSLADYVLVSYRKWPDLLCAIVYSKDKFSLSFSSVTYDEYVHDWRKAATLKKQYLNQEISDKAEFLQLYDRANSLLAENYKGFTATNDDIAQLNSIHTKSLINQRRNNAHHLIDTIKSLNLPNVQLMFDHLGDNDCPLFVPILVNEQSRDAIRRRLIDKSIYCPAHWPIDETYPYYQTQYHNCEISLICDQRYDIEDMNREIEELIIALSE